MNLIESQILVPIVLILAAYLIGSVPNSVWIGKLFHGVDVREHGSGNAGATNTIRVLGLKTGIPVLILDAFKGWLAIQLAYFSNVDMLSDEYLTVFRLILAAAAVLGHIFPVYIGFKGGKGMATLIGVGLALFPLPLLICLSLFTIIFVITKYVSLGSIIGAMIFPVLTIFVFDFDMISMIFSILVGIFVPLTHRKNIVRLIKGTELKMTFKKKN